MLTNTIYKKIKNIEIQPGTEYIVIDCLYLNDIQNELAGFSPDGDIKKTIRESVFPYTDTPFAAYITSKSIFSITQIKKGELNLQNPADSKNFLLAIPEW